MHALIFALVAVGLASCGGGTLRSHALDTAPLALEAPVVIALEPDLSRPVVRVTLDDRSSRPFVVDCGAGISLVHAARAAELGFVVRPYASGFDVIGSGGASSRVESYVLVEELRIGTLRVEAARIAVIDDDALLDAGVDGILGQDLLARLIVVVDMQRDQLHLVPNDGPDAVQRYVESNDLGRGSWLKLEVPFGPQPAIPIDIDEADELELWLDTGAEVTSLPARLLEYFASTPTGTTEVGGIGGRFVREAHTLTDFRFFGLSISGEFSASAIERGLIGMDVLGQFVLVLDGPAHTVWLHHRDDAAGD